MKSIILTLLIVPFSFTFAEDKKSCPNLSGLYFTNYRYDGTSYAVELRIGQKNCQMVTFYETGEAFDGTKRTWSSLEEIVIPEIPGKFDYRWQGNQLVGLIVDPRGEELTSYWTLETEQNFLIHEVLYPYGAVHATGYRRVLH